MTTLTAKEAAKQGETVSRFLTKDEVCKLTGAVKRSKQIDELTRRGYDFEVNAKGEIVIWANSIDKRFGVVSSEPKKYQLNKKALRAAING